MRYNKKQVNDRVTEKTAALEATIQRNLQVYSDNCDDKDKKHRQELSRVATKFFFFGFMLACLLGFAIAQTMLAWTRWNKETGGSFWQWLGF